MSTLTERLEWALDYSGLKKSDLARACNITRSAVTAWFNGSTQTLEGSNLANVARVTRCMEYWIATGKGPRTTEEGRKWLANTHSAELKRRAYPLISWVHAGAWKEIVDAYPYGSSDVMVFANDDHSHDSFALRIEGNSMEPIFQEGDIIIVDPDIQPRPGDYVVAKNHQAEATFKKYRPRGIDADGKTIFELVPLNDDYATLRSDQENIRIIGVQVEHTRFRKP